MHSSRPPSDSGLEDAEWIAAILGNSTPALKEECYARLLRKYWKTINVLVLSKIRDRREAEDICQEAFVRAFRGLPELRRPAAFLGWLLRITRNLISDHLRSRRHEASLDVLGTNFARDIECSRGQARSVGAEEELALSEELALAMEALGALPEPYREVVTLRYLQGLDGKTMARLLGEPEGTVRNRLFRALEKLRILLARKRREIRESEKRPSDP